MVVNGTENSKSFGTGLAILQTIVLLILIIFIAHPNNIHHAEALSFVEIVMIAFLFSTLLERTGNILSHRLFWINQGLRLIILIAIIILTKVIGDHDIGRSMLISTSIYILSIISSRFIQKNKKE